MTLEITVQIQVGSVAFSFKTDESGAGFDDGIKAIQKLIKLHSKTLASVGTVHPATKTELSSPIASAASLRELKIEPQLKDKAVANLRKVPYWDLVLMLLYHSTNALTYDDLMSLSKQLGKPISYDWLNTEFQRKQYRGLVRSEAILGSKKRVYSITELGRRKAESFFERLRSE